MQVTLRFYKCLLSIRTISSLENQVWAKFSHMDQNMSQIKKIKYKFTCLIYQTDTQIRKIGYLHKAYLNCGVSRLRKPSQYQRYMGINHTHLQTMARSFKCFTSDLTRFTDSVHLIEILTRGSLLTVDAGIDDDKSHSEALYVKNDILYASAKLSFSSSSSVYHYHFLEVVKASSLSQQIFILTIKC